MTVCSFVEDHFSEEEVGGRDGKILRSFHASMSNRKTTERSISNKVGRRGLTVTKVVLSLAMTHLVHTHAHIDVHTYTHTLCAHIVFG